MRYNDKKALSCAFLRYMTLILASFVFVALASFTAVHADEEEEGDWVHYVGVATGRVNVRSGAGEEYDKLTDSDGNSIQLEAQQEIEILDEAVASSDRVWYKIKFQRDGVEYIGWSTSSYISKLEDRMITPSPTPIPTATPTPVPTATPVPAADENIATPSLIKEDDTAPNSKATLLKVIYAVIAVAVLFFVLVIVLGVIRNRKHKDSTPASRKVDKLKKMNLDNKDTNRKLPQIKKFEDEDARGEEVRQDVYYKKTYDYSLASDEEVKANAVRESDEKKALRAAIEHLQEHDIVYHVIYGEGEVFDNSDVKLLEVRFGNDMRFLKKDQLVARHELKIVDEEEQSIAKRRSRRKVTH